MCIGASLLTGIVGTGPGLSGSAKCGESGPSGSNLGTWFADIGTSSAWPRRSEHGLFVEVLTGSLVTVI